MGPSVTLALQQPVFLPLITACQISLGDSLPSHCGVVGVALSPDALHSLFDSGIASHRVSSLGHRDWLRRGCVLQGSWGEVRRLWLEVLEREVLAFSLAGAIREWRLRCINSVLPVELEGKQAGNWTQELGTLSEPLQLVMPGLVCYWYADQIAIIKKLMGAIAQAKHISFSGDS